MKSLMPDTIKYALKTAAEALRLAEQIETTIGRRVNMERRWR